MIERRWPQLWSGQKASFITWLTLIAILLVLGALLHEGLMRDWTEHGLPDWSERYLRWEKRTLYEWGFRGFRR